MFTAIKNRLANLYTNKIIKRSTSTEVISKSKKAVTNIIFRRLKKNPYQYKVN
jgi:hypothetical protein